MEFSFWKLHFWVLSTVLLFSNLAFSQRSGQEIYEQLCAVCHQANGLGSVIEGGLFSGDNFHETRVEAAGIPAAFPPLANNISKTYDLAGGQEYLLTVLLFGLTGSITIEGQIYDGIMPSWGNLSDQELANVLNYSLINWAEDGVKYNIEAQDFAALRALDRSPEYNYQARAKLLQNSEPNK